jgi:hypothetical protein
MNSVGPLGNSKKVADFLKENHCKTPEVVEQVEKFVASDLEGSFRGIFKVLSWNLPVGTEETHELTSQASRCPD